MWLTNGVELNEDPVGVNHSVNIKYKGLLANSGADGIMLHYGKDGWNDTKCQWMSRQADGSFQTQLKAEAAHEVNFCFKDSADNWDNNNGWNWRVRVV